VLSYTFDREY